MMNPPSSPRPGGSNAAAAGTPLRTPTQEARRPSLTPPRLAVRVNTSNTRITNRDRLPSAPRPVPPLPCVRQVLLELGLLRDESNPQDGADHQGGEGNPQDGADPPQPPRVAVARFAWRPAPADGGSGEEDEDGADVNLIRLPLRRARRFGPENPGGRAPPPPIPDFHGL